MKSEDRGVNVRQHAILKGINCMLDSIATQKKPSVHTMIGSIPNKEICDHIQDNLQYSQQAWQLESFGYTVERVKH